MKSIRFVFLCVALLLFNGILLATVPTPATGGSPTCWPPPCVPIDNGVIVLMCLGALYGLKKIYDHKKSAVSQS